MGKVVTFGEIMLRLTPPGCWRLAQSVPGRLQAAFAGSEANVAVSISLLGGQSAFLTALPDNDLSTSCVSTLRALGVETRHIHRVGKGRLGIYFLETGSDQRAGQVIYDREGASINLIEPDEYDWDGIFDGAAWFHISGITPALSEVACRAALHAVRTAKEKNARVSCDLNFRKKLWRWDSSRSPRVLAEERMREVLPYVDVVIANEEDASMVLGIAPPETDVEAGKLAVAQYPAVAKEILNQFPRIQKVAVTLRESVSASFNRWGGMLYDRDRGSAFFAPEIEGKYRPYEIRNIVDRVGAGDAFSAGLIFALVHGFEDTKAVAFAAAASCLAHTIQGDFNFSSRQEVERLMKGAGSGRVNR